MNPDKLTIVGDCDGKSIPTSQVSIPNAYMSLAFEIRTAGFPGPGGRINSGALPRWKPTTSLSDQRSGRDTRKEDPKPVMHGIPSGLTNMFCCESASHWRLSKCEINDNLTEQRRPWTISRSCTCFNPRAMPWI